MLLVLVLVLVADLNISILTSKFLIQIPMRN